MKVNAKKQAYTRHRNNKLTQDTSLHGISIDEKYKDQATLWCVCKIPTKAQGWHNGVTHF